MSVFDRIKISCVEVELKILIKYQQTAYIPLKLK